MRLIRISSLQLEEFDSDPPPYAIASHRWTKEEITFQEFSSASKSEPDLWRQAGYKKISSFRKAISHLVWSLCPSLAVDYLWIDTVCIDKTNSVELQEALNSMFRWYAEAEVCLAHLHDVVSLDVHPSTLRKSLGESDWFTRGWTLQELIAPRCIFFYNKDWDIIGIKATVHDTPWMTTRAAGLIPLNSVLTEITGVPDRVLSAFQYHIDEYSSEQKRSWMNGRSTTRKEDRVYCQLGIFGVFMPLIYGEGDHAMYRLEEAIEQKQRRLEAQVRRIATLPASVGGDKSDVSRGQSYRPTDGIRGKTMKRFSVFYGNQTPEEKVVVVARDDIPVWDLKTRVLEELKQTPWGRSQGHLLYEHDWILSSSGSKKNVLSPDTQVADLPRDSLSLLPRSQ